MSFISKRENCITKNINYAEYKNDYKYKNRKHVFLQRNNNYR